MDKNNYLEAVKDALENLQDKRGQYWTWEEKSNAQKRTIRTIVCLKDKKMRDAIEEMVRLFRGDIWELSEEIIKFLLDKKISPLPPVDAIAVLILHLFYAGALLDIDAIFEG